ncbi:MAG: D-alanine--D-alanine ligase [Deltaproteobacteria bacterium]|nr:D-alanine--D-alanine ligase [Deltaproteobacteria bacterium]MBW2415112.1 D-alanine--D-alanine ligase [Deltaproteobacteria bacterium]
MRVALLFGGTSTEHEVSVSSATTVLQALDPARYTPVLVGLDHDGSWAVLEDPSVPPEGLFDCPDTVRCFPTLRGGLEFLRFDDAGDSALSGPLDVVFPIIHGRGGEDGSLQGAFEVAGVPYVGAGVLATALCMDKTLSKRTLRDAGLPVLPSHEASRHEVLEDATELIARVERDFDYPVFVKPTNTGSSVGVARAADRAELEAAIAQAAQYDRWVLVEPAADAREVECAVLGGHSPEGSVLGEIGHRGEFYDYEAKYVSDSTELVIPAPIPEALAEQVRSLAVDAFVALKCWGFARVDFFVDRRTEQIYLNELNTLPGFTEGSMYPRLWEASGIALPELVDRLIELALERHREQGALVTRYTS